jgi:SagB-type dehydrogenase family enzyme
MLFIRGFKGRSPMVFTEERRRALIGFLNWVIAIWLPLFLSPRRAAGMAKTANREDVVKLPPPETAGTVSVEEAIALRRTVRAFLPRSLEMRQLSQLLWAAQGITGKRGLKRAAPSAGALYPMDVYVVAGPGAVGQLAAGGYRYEPGDHALSHVKGGDLRVPMANASLHQMWMAGAPLDFVITAEYRRITGKYGERGIRYAMMEAGHMGQNLFLQARALGLGAGIVGAFRDAELIEVLGISSFHEPLLVMPVGYPA